MIRTGMVVLFCGALAAPLHGYQDGSADPARKNFQISRASGEILIDGKLDESVWQSALALELPYNTRPGENTPAPVHTTCYLTYDDGHFYLGCRADDPEPEKIRARLSALARWMNSMRTMTHLHYRLRGPTRGSTDRAVA